MSISLSTPAPGGKPEARRVLMIAHDFPPVNRSSALRALKMSRYLNAYGWGVSVITGRIDAGCPTDAALLRDVPPDCRIHQAFGFDTKAALSVRGRYLRVLATPDRHVSWFPHGVMTGVRVCRRDRADVLLSTSPPVTAHCIGWAVSRITRRPWIVELRDPWNLDTPPGALARLDGHLERRILTVADRVVVTTAGLAAALGHRFGEAIRHKTRLIPNGYDEDAFARLPEAVPLAGRFHISHTGQCMPPDRDPVPFLRVVRRCLDRGTLPADTEVRFIGAGSAFAVRVGETLRQLRLESHVRITDRLPHAAAVRATLEAPVLLLLQDRNEHRDSIPAKAYEYLRSPACILVLAPPRSATTALMKDFPGVLCAASADSEAIAERLEEAVALWKQAAGSLHFARGVERYSSRRLAAELASLLEDVYMPPQTADRCVR